MEILPADQMTRTVLSVEHFCEKRFPGHAHHGFVKMGKDDFPDPIEPMDQIGPVLGGVDQLYGGVGV